MFFEKTLEYCTASEQTLSGENFVRAISSSSVCQACIFVMLQGSLLPIPDDQCLHKMLRQSNFAGQSLFAYCILNVHFQRDYEITGDTSYGEHFGPKNSRTSNRNVLDGCQVCCYGDFVDIKCGKY